MKDRELLERAAKAAGRDDLIWVEECGAMMRKRDSAIGYWPGPWSPLADDGDCARLETVCGISPMWSSQWVDSHCTIIKTRVIAQLEDFADHGGDKNKARRYASVRAAAAMG